MASHKIAFYNWILPAEGGYGNDPKDPGNWCGNVNYGTHKGLSAAAFNSIYGRCPSSIEELKQVSESQGENIFKWHYWDKLHLDQMQSQELANILSDWIYNGGPAIEWMIAHGGPGDWKKIISTLNAKDPKALIQSVLKEREKYYRYLATAFPQKYAGFLRGWLNRLDRFRAGMVASGKSGKSILPFIAFAFLWLVRKRSI